MRRIKIMGLCLVAVFAVSAMGASAAPAAVTATEYGSCRKVTEVKEGSKTGVTYSDKACRTEDVDEQLIGGRDGDFEWQPGGSQNTEQNRKLINWKFTSSGLTSILKTPAFGPGGVECKKNNGTGEITGPKADVDTTTFEECEGLAKKCNSFDQAAGSGIIKTFPLASLLIGPGETGPKSEGPAPGEVWSQFSGTVEAFPVETPGVRYLAVFECEGPVLRVHGTVAGVTKEGSAENVNKMNTKNKVTFAELTAEQNGANLKTEANTGSGFEPTGGAPSFQEGVNNNVNGFKTGSATVKEKTEIRTP